MENAFCKSPHLALSPAPMHFKISVFLKWGGQIQNVTLSKPFSEIDEWFTVCSKNMFTGCPVVLGNA